MCVEGCLSPVPPPGLTGSQGLSNTKQVTPNFQDGHLPAASSSQKSCLLTFESREHKKFQKSEGTVVPSRLREKHWQPHHVLMLSGGGSDFSMERRVCLYSCSI